MIDSINKLGKLMLNTPPLKNDYYLYRFIWDGRLLITGVSPYIFTPENLIIFQIFYQTNLNFPTQFIKRQAVKGMI